MVVAAGSAVVRYEDPVEVAERSAVAGFLAGYSDTTLVSYRTEMRLFAVWCNDTGLRLLEVKRAHLEIFARWMEANGRMRSTVARRLSTLSSFYRYCHIEGILDRDPAVNVRRPKVDYKSRTLGLDRNELGGLLVQAALGTPRDDALVTLLAMNELRISEALGADIDDLEFDRGHERCASCAKAANTSPSHSLRAPAGRWICTSTNAGPGRSSSVSTAEGWTATPRTAP